MFCTIILVCFFLGFISIVAQFARDTGPHLLGPYLGEYLSIQLVRAFGKLPVLCILVSTLVAGIKILNPAWDKLAWRRVMVGFVGTLLISLILSIPFQTMQEPILYDFENTGGYVGSLLVHFILHIVTR